MDRFAKAPGAPQGTPPESHQRDRQRIQERARHPRHAGRIEPADGSGAAVNPHCGDSVVVSLRFSPDRCRLEAVRCACRGCVLSVASADLMAELVGGQTPEAVEALACGMAAPPRCLTGLPARARCVLLPWQALRLALALADADADADADGSGIGVADGAVIPGAPG